jgi:hypothetical protein
MIASPFRFFLLGGWTELAGRAAVDPDEGAAELRCAGSDNRDADEQKRPVNYEITRP